MRGKTGPDRYGPLPCGASACCTFPWAAARRFLARGLGALVLLLALSVQLSLFGGSLILIGTVSAHAQAQPPVPPSTGWQSGTTTPPAGNAQPPATAAIAPKAGQPSPAPAAKPSSAVVTLVATLTEGGHQIDRGLVWRIFAAPSNAKGKLKLLAISRQATPAFELTSGKYVVNAAFGRAYLTRTITVKAGETTTEQFVLNAGGLQIKPVLGALRTTASKAIRYDILSDERDKFGKRIQVLRGAKPGLIIRLNAGIYHVVSSYGDANAIVSSDVTVEAGKLTQVSVRHSASRVTFKLVRRPGGEALSDTKWQITTPKGQIVKKTVGALPTHVLAAGRYVLNATHGGKTYQREFTLQPGEITHVEVVVP